MDEPARRAVVVLVVDGPEAADRSVQLIRLLAVGIARRARGRHSVDYVGDVSVDVDVRTDDRKW